MAKKGYFILTDISGYTEFLTKSELDHAQETLQALFDVQLAHIKHPFVLSGFRGDAIFLYVPETNFCAPQTLLESLENLYFVFADTLRHMIANTTCACLACKNMSKLDLKMTIHYGEYVVQKLGDREELLCADVIVPHRMLKKSVIGLTGIESYALFSEAATAALDLPALAHPRLGPPIPAAAGLGIHDQPADRAALFRVRSDRAYRFSWWRMQPEATYHCVKGELQFFNTILDWKPFDYLSLRQKVTVGVELTQTRSIEPLRDGSRLTISIQRPPENATDESKEPVRIIFNDTAQKMIDLLAADVAGGKVTSA